MNFDRNDLTDEQVRSLLPLLHWIPVTKGLQRKWWEQNAPGGNVGDILEELKSIGRIVRTRWDFPPFRLVGVCGHFDP